MYVYAYAFNKIYIASQSDDLNVIGDGYSPSPMTK